MKHLLYIALFFLPILCYSQTDTVIISDRVGSIIDRYEREYFRLFPDADDFKSACFIPDNNVPDQINIHIKTGNQEDTQILEIKNEHISRLNSYIDRYENIRLAQSYFTFKRNYRSLYYEDIISFMEFEDLPEMTLHVSDNQHRTQITMGLLLYADRDVVIMSESFDSLNLHSVHIFNTSNIVSIKYRDGGAFWRGFVSGTLVTGGALTLLIFATNNHDNPINGRSTPTVAYGIGSAMVSVFVGILAGLINHFEPYTNEEEIDNRQQYLDILPKLRERQFFKHGLPPELRKQLYNE